MRPPRYYDQDFMAQRWSCQRGSTVHIKVQKWNPAMRRHKETCQKLETIDKARDFELS